MNAVEADASSSGNGQDPSEREESGSEKEERESEKREYASEKRECSSEEGDCPPGESSGASEDLAHVGTYTGVSTGRGCSPVALPLCGLKLSAVPDSGLPREVEGKSKGADRNVDTGVASSSIGDQGTGQAGTAAVASIGTELALPDLLSAEPHGCREGGDDARTGDDDGSSMFPPTKGQHPGTELPASWGDTRVEQPGGIAGGTGPGEKESRPIVVQGGQW